MRTTPRSKAGAIPALAVALLALSAPATARPPELLVDQQQPLIDAAENTVAIGGASEQKIAQTLTVGIEGRLARVAFPIACGAGVLEVEIQGVTPTGEPDGGTLVRRSFRAEALPGPVPASFVELSLPRRLAVSPGDQIAVVLSNPTGSCGIASSPDGDTYGGGRLYFDSRPNPPGWIPWFPLAAEDDLPFQTGVFGTAL